jgi:RNA polymerase sigma factor (sigma-70 family)
VGYVITGGVLHFRNSVMGDSHQTHASLLRDLTEHPDRWQEFVNLYGPLITRYLRRKGVPDGDAEDLCQDVLAILVRRIPRWNYDPSRGRFRGYVKTIVAHAAQRFWEQRKRGREAVGGTAHRDMLEARPEGEGAGDEWFEQEWQRSAFELACKQVQAEVDARTWKVFVEHAISGRSPGEVAAEHGMNVGNVYVIRTRVIRRLRAAVEALDE